jgi:hypothetical protein
MLMLSIVMQDGKSIVLNGEKMLKDMVKSFRVYWLPTGTGSGLFGSGCGTGSPGFG